MNRRSGLGDRGAAEVVAAVLIAPVVVGFVVIVFFLGRQVDSRAAVRSAAEAAAQAGARQRDPATADAAAHDVVVRMLADTSVCQGGPTVAVDVTGFGPGGIVTVDVTCVTRTSDLAAIAAPSRTFTGHAAAVVDVYRAVP